MKKILQSAALLLVVYSCHPPDVQKSAVENPIRLYSKEVKDTFSISVSLPTGYDSTKEERYPVVYLLDANVYFDIMAATLQKYAEVGLLPPAILVGLGYKDIQTMDSLRNRDYTYPVAIPEYEMANSGGAERFMSFITKELMPEIDAKYSVDQNKRVLFGHSLGGYFTVYALNQCLLNKSNAFSGYVAASPSTHYNHNYLLKELEKLSPMNRPEIKAYATFGGLEDAEEAEEDSTATLMKTEHILHSLNQTLGNRVRYKGETYSNLGHMDMPIPTFIKGLQWTLGEGE